MFNTLGVKTLSYERILELVPLSNLWSYYLGEEIVLGKRILSPVRVERNPSAVLFKSFNGDILLIDHGLGRTYNIFSFLKERYKLTEEEIIKKVDTDFQLGYYTEVLYPTKLSITPIEPKEYYKSIKVSRKPWNKVELQYWYDYHFTDGLLEELHINPLRSYVIIDINKEESTQFNKQKDELLFCFSFGEAMYKIYRPFGSGNLYKWTSNVPSSTLMGFDSLPWTGENLIITKGMKELGQLRRLNYPSIALQGENSYPKQNTIDSLKRRFKNIYSLMDNDEAGKTASKSLLNRFGFKPLYVPEFEEGKDFAEFSKVNGLEKAKEVIQEQL